MRCTTEYGHSPQCPNVNACTTKRRRQKIKAEKLQKAKCVQAAAAVAIIVLAVTCAPASASRAVAPSQVASPADATGADAGAAATSPAAASSIAGPSTSASSGAGSSGSWLTPLKQQTLFDLLSTSSPGSSPVTEKPAAVDAQQLVQCVLWFRGQFHLAGKKKEAAYTEAQKKVADLMRTVPTKRLLQLQAVSSMQQAQGALPNIPTVFAGYFAAKAATVPSVRPFARCRLQALEICRASATGNRPGGCY